MKTRRKRMKCKTWLYSISISPGWMSGIFLTRLNLTAEASEGGDQVQSRCVVSFTVLGI